MDHRSGHQCRRRLYQVLEFLIAVATQIGVVLYEGSLYILVGFLIAGLLHEYLPTEAIARHLGGDNLRSVILAALFGAPIPLCSCGVLPAAAALRAKGASKSATLSFLISTPETGVDSIALTYGLLGPVMAVVRPLVAIITGAVAGIISIITGEGRDEDKPPYEDSCGDGHNHCADELCEESAATIDYGAQARVRRVTRYGFISLLDELAFWIIVGVALTGLLAAALPDNFFATTLGLGSGVIPMLAMVIVGAPLYLCASASTPIAAALIAKGLSPGAALVFLLVGPATNAATMTVTAKLLGARKLRIYLGSIIVVSIAAGLLLDSIGGEALRTTALSTGARADATWLQAIKVAAAVVFSILITASLRRTGVAAGLRELREQSSRLITTATDFDYRSLATGPVLAGVVALGLIAAIPAATLIVSPGQRGITKRFGRISASGLQPGLYLHLPAPFGQGLAVDVSLIRQVTVGFRGATNGERRGLSQQAYYLTADENIIDMRAVVHYRVDDPVRYALGIEAADQLMLNLVRRELVETVGKQPIDTLYTSDRRTTERTVLEGLRQRSARVDCGCEVLELRLLDVHAPADIHDAFRDVSSSLEDRDRQIKIAEGYAAELLAEAGGQARVILERARSDAFAKKRNAEGTATAFSGLAAVHRTNPKVTETRMYLETLEQALKKPRKYIGGTGSAYSEVDLWIGLGDKTPATLALPAADDPRRGPRKRPGNDYNKEPR